MWYIPSKCKFFSTIQLKHTFHYPTGWSVVRNYNSYFLEVTVSENFRLSPKQQTENCFFLFFLKMARGNPTYNHMFILCRWAKCIQITYNKHFIKLIYSNKLFYFKVCDLSKLSKYRIIIYKRSPTLCPPLK